MGYYGSVFIGHGRHTDIFFKEFLAKLKNENYHALILVVALSTLSMELFEPMLKNLNKPWRNFWKLHLWFYTTPQEEGKFFNLFLQFLPAQQGMNYVDYHCDISKICYCMLLVKRFDLAFLNYFDLGIILLFITYNYLLSIISYLLIVIYHFSSQFK